MTQQPTTERPKCVTCPSPATGKGDYPHLCWNHTPEDQDAYPVIVEYTYRHVVWVHADNQRHAAEILSQDAYEHTSNDTLAGADWTTQAPEDDLDWGLVYNDGLSDGAYEMAFDAHVKTHRTEMLRQKWATEKAACVEAKHPRREDPLSDGSQWCPGCRVYLAPEVVEIPAVSR